jgi:hypothetical protein
MLSSNTINMPNTPSILSNQHPTLLLTSQLHNASCFQSISIRSNASADLKQPLLVVVQDLESSSSSYSQEEQENDIAKRAVSNRILVKCLCFGAFVGLLVQAVTFSAFLVFVIHWGNNPKPDTSAPFSYWTLYLIIHIDFIFYTLVWGIVVVMTVTKKGSMHMRKKFDNDADAPNNDSIWTSRFLFHSGLGFLLGVIVGSCAAWTIIDAELGMPVPYMPLLYTLLMDTGLCCLMIKCFDWGHGPDPFSTAPPDDDSFFV